MIEEKIGGDFVKKLPIYDIIPRANIANPIAGRWNFNGEY